NLSLSNPKVKSSDSQRRVDLERLRRALWAAWRAGKEPRAPLSREIRAVTRELDGLAPATGGSKADELVARRQARNANATARVPATRRSQPRRSAGGRRTR